MAETLLLEIKEIAKWPNEQVSVPVLQRGLVWNPKQIELFWDSIMRGIPVGSFVVCKNVKNQHRNSTDTSEYHLLDGQQRANAIFSQKTFPITPCFAPEQDWRLKSPEKRIAVFAESFSANALLCARARLAVERARKAICRR